MSDFLSYYINNILVKKKKNYIRNWNQFWKTFYKKAWIWKVTKHLKSHQEFFSSVILLNLITYNRKIKTLFLSSWFYFQNKKLSLNVFVSLCHTFISYWVIHYTNVLHRKFCFYTGAHEVFNDLFSEICILTPFTNCITFGKVLVLVYFSIQMWVMLKSTSLVGIRIK